MKATTTPDDLNPKYLFSITATELLVQIASGKVDANQLAKDELRARGLNFSGVWVGFKETK